MGWGRGIPFCSLRALPMNFLGMCVEIQRAEGQEFFFMLWFKATRLKNELNRHISRGHIKVVSKLLKRHSTSLIVRETQIKTTMRYHYIPIRMAAISKRENKYWWGGRELRTLVHHWWEYKQYDCCEKQYGGSSES